MVFKINLVSMFFVSEFLIKKPSYNTLGSAISEGSVGRFGGLFIISRLRGGSGTPHSPPTERTPAL